MEQELTTLLATAAPRRYWGRGPQPAPQRPYVVLTRVSGIRDYHYKGASGAVDSRVQIDIYADTYLSASNTASSIVSALSGYSGGTIQAIFVNSQRNLTGLSGGGMQTDPDELFRISVDVMVHHEE